MPNYAETYSRLADRAARQGGIDIETFVEQHVAHGVPPERIEQLLLDDIEQEGSVFGKFIRSLTGAAEASVMAAERQGDLAATALARADMERFLNRSEVGLALEEADPVGLENVEAIMADRVEYTWIATLKRTCDRCLPLHGKSMSYGEWLSSGLHPDTIHNGWTSSCQCSLVPADESGSRKELVDPIVREKPKGADRTVRAVTQADVERARTAVLKARETEEGRSILRQLGQVGDREDN